MAFTRQILPAGGAPGVIHYSGSRWFVFDDFNQDVILVTSDWATYTETFTADIGFTSYQQVSGVSYGAGAWHFVCGTLNGLWKSTDGATGAAWTRTTPDFSNGLNPTLGVKAKNIHVTTTGRIIVMGRWGVSYSDDGGTTWTVASEDVFANTNIYGGGIRQFGSTIVAWGGLSSGLLHSTDNGSTWTFMPTSALTGGITGVAKIGTSWLIATDQGTDVPLLSTNNGSTWAPLAGFDTDVYGLDGDGTSAVLLRENSPNVSVFTSTDLSIWTAGDATGLSSDTYNGGPTPIYVTAGWHAATSPGIGTAPGVFLYSTAAPPPDPIGLPVRLEVQTAVPISLVTRLQIGETGPAIALPSRLSLVPDAVLGGLSGAGGWPSAPGGDWMAVVSLAGADISDDLVGQVVVQFADNEARTAEFSFLPPTVLQPMGIVGQRVQIAFAQRDTSGAPVAAQVIFTGVVETPTINMQTGVIYCTCHDQLQEVFANTSRSWIDANLGGRWREEISGEPADNWDYLEARRQSVPSSVALDAFQQPRVLGWRSGLTEVNVQAADMLDGTLAVDLPSRDDLRTRITVSFEYRFERLRGRGVTAAYSNPIAFYISDPSKLWLTSAMVKEAAEGVSGWSIDSLLIENPNPGSYWRGASIEDGVYVIPPEVAPDLALGFSARYHARWQQTLTQAYTVELVLPALEAQIGRVAETVSATMDVPFEAQDWAMDASVLPALAIPTVGDVVSTWQPAGSDNAARDEVLRTLLDQAWVKLWGASRSGRVRFVIPLRPNMWLDNLVTVQTGSLNARGKVVEGEHRMDTETGEAVTTVALAVGLPGDTAASMPTWSLPTVPALSEERPPATYSFDIGTHVGGLLTSPPWDEAAMVGFATNVELPNALAENFYPHQLSIKAPDVIAEDRDPLTQAVAQTVETTIPTDLLELL